MIPFTQMQGGRTVLSFYADATAAREHAHRAGADPQYAYVVLVESNEIRARYFVSDDPAANPSPAPNPSPSFVVLTVERP